MDTDVRNLLGTLSSEKGMERKRARETVVLVGDSAGTQVRSLLGSGDKRLRWEAAKALSAMVDPSSLPALVELLKDQESDLRWLAADGLINLGPRSVAPVLRSLLGGPPSKGQIQMTGRVLRKLATENDVLQEIVAPVVEVLTDTVAPEVLQPRAAQALADLDRLTGRLPSP